MSTANPGATARNAESKRGFSNDVLPLWLHHLPLLDPKSEDFAELLLSFLSSKDERMNILALSEGDARLFIEIIDSALHVAQLEPQLRHLAFAVLTRLCGKIGYLPESYLLSDKFDLSGMPHTSGGFSDVRKCVFKGKAVAVRSLRVSEVDNKARVRKNFCKEVVMWKNLSHPNVLYLIGAPDTLEDGMFSVVSEWMANGNIMEYVRNSPGNHLKLLADAAEGLKYLHNANVVHGDLKGANILIKNTNPVTACLADFGFMSIVYDPSLGMDSSSSTVGGGTTPFMAPELLVPSRFGLDKCRPSKEADTYAIAVVIYQVLTGTLPFGEVSGSELVLKIMEGEKPTKPANALELGLSDEVWSLLEGCWQADRALRPSIEDVSGRVNAAASVRGILSPVGSVPLRHEDPDSEFNKSDQAFLGMTPFDHTGIYPIDRPQSQGPTLAGALTHGSFSELSMAEGSIAEPVQTSTEHGPGFSNDAPPGLHNLPSLGPESEEFVQWFRSSLLSKDERTNILASSGGDAKLFIEIINMALHVAQLEPQLRHLSVCLLVRLCGKTGHLPESHLLSNKFDLSEKPRVSGGFADVRMGVFKGKDVAVKSLRISEVDDRAKIRKRFCKEAAMWKNLSHPNVLDLIGVPNTLEDGRFSMVSEWMTNGNIMEYVRKNAGNHLALLADAAEGLKYLHNVNIVHGDLKGANILIKNTDPVTACLADFGFMTIVYDPSLGMESSKSTAGGGTTPFMAPELLAPSRFGLDKCKPSKEADVYAMGVVIYQVLTGMLPFGEVSGFELVLKIMAGEKPSKPTNASEFGLSDEVWNLLEGCWKTQRTLRPFIEDVSGRINAAASVCGTLSPVGNASQRHEDPGSDFNKFDDLFLGMTPFDNEDIGIYPMDRPPSQGSTLTDTSAHGSLFSKHSEAESSITEPDRTSIDALASDSHSKGESTDTLPDILSGLTSDPAFTMSSISRSSTPDSDAIVRPRLIRDNSSPYRNKGFAESNASSRTLLPVLE